MDNEIDCSSSLSSDYWKLYESENYTDLSIHVGREPHSKIFLAHALVLCTRCKYLESSLAGDVDTSKDIQRTTLTFEDVMPEVFEILLRFIYTGKVSYNSHPNIDWINLLKGAVKFELDDLVTAIENLLVTKKKDLIQRHILTVQKFASTAANLNKLLDYCNQTMTLHPEIIFKSNNLLNLSKETLITILQNDDLNMKEGDIWMSVIEWAIAQVPGLKNNPNSWSSGEVNTIKSLVADCIPHVRFTDIAYEELVEKFVFYDELLPAKLRHDILVHHLQNKDKPDTENRPLRGYKTVGATMDVDEQTKTSSRFSVVAGPSSSFGGFGEQPTFNSTSGTSANPFLNSTDNRSFGGFRSNKKSEAKVLSFSGFGKITSDSADQKKSETKGEYQPILTHDSQVLPFSGFGKITSDSADQKKSETKGEYQSNLNYDSKLLPFSGFGKNTSDSADQKNVSGGFTYLNNKNETKGEYRPFSGFGKNTSDSADQKNVSFGGFGSVSPLNVSDSTKPFGLGSFGSFGSFNSNASSDSTDGKKSKNTGRKSNAGSGDGAQGFQFGGSFGRSGFGNDGQDTSHSTHRKKFNFKEELFGSGERKSNAGSDTQHSGYFWSK